MKTYFLANKAGEDHLKDLSWIPKDLSSVGKDISSALKDHSREPSTGAARQTHSTVASAAS